MKYIVNNLETRQELKEFLQNHKNKVVILKASASWCDPCKRIKDDFNRLFNDMPEGVSLIELDIDDGDDIATFLKIRKVPTMMNFVNGRPMDIYTTAEIHEVNQFFEKTKTHLTMGF
tara:strand:- start:3063 stop:3413 length:351 start_codon:yes stop_codon:yes gene_type:complete